MRLNDSIIPPVELMNADAVLKAFDEIDRENRTNNAIAHPASCRGIAPARGGWPHCTDRPRGGH